MKQCQLDHSEGFDILLLTIHALRWPAIMTLVTSRGATRQRTRHVSLNASALAFHLTIASDCFALQAYQKACSSRATAWRKLSAHWLDFLNKWPRLVWLVVEHSRGGCLLCNDSLFWDSVEYRIHKLRYSIAHVRYDSLVISRSSNIVGDSEHWANTP